jgi:hypothetical protein
MTEGGFLRSDAADAALHTRNFRNHLGLTLTEKDDGAELLEQSQGSAEFENESQSSYSSIREMYKNEIAKFAQPLLEQDHNLEQDRMCGMSLFALILHVLPQGSRVVFV